jgi:hypothetical protein
MLYCMALFKFYMMKQKLTIPEVFERFPIFINQVAAKADMNPSLLRQYVSGCKTYSTKQAKKVEKALHSIGKEVLKTSIFK